MANSSFRERLRLRRLAARLSLSLLAIVLPPAARAFLTSTTISLTAAPSGVTYYSGQAITYTATVSANSGTPTGNVTFTFDSTATTTVPLDSSRNAVVLLHPLAGSHTLSAAYNGGATFSTSTSSTLTQSISKAATTVGMAATAAQIGQPLSLRALVTIQSPGSGTPAGTVDFAIGTTPIAGCSAVPLVAAVAVCNTSLPQIGTYNIGTIYNGDASTAPSGGSMAVTVGKAVPGVYAAADPPAQAIGGAVTLGAQILGATGVAAPSGTVTFSDGSLVLISVPVGTDGHATLVVPSGPVPAFGPGAHTIVALYNGDSNYLAAPATAITVTMSGKAATSLTVSAGAAQILQPVTIKATVSAIAAGGATGTVDFSNLDVPISGCFGVAVQNAIALCTTSFTQAGAVTVNANYSGDGSYTASKGTMQLSVGKATSWVFVTASPASPVLGTAVTLSALATGSAGLATPSGTVTFSDGSAALGTSPVGTDGRASLVVPSFSIGTHNLTAVYNGDTIYLTATAPTVALLVGKPAATLTLTSTVAQLAQPVKITAATSSANAGGTVDFANGANPIAGCTAVPVQNGAAACNTAFSQVGAVTINASYSGDSNTAASTAALLLTVGKCDAGTYLAAAPANPAYGAVVTLGALVLGAAGVANPTGSITFQDGTTLIGTAPLGSDGHATLLVPSGAIAPLSIGAHTITAVYGGDSNYLTATAQPLSLTVAKAAPTVTVSATPDSPKAGQNATLTATLSPAATGTVAFANGAIPISGCTANPVASGVATCTTSFPQTGTFAITASYSGDANAAAAAGALTLTVTQPKSAATVSLQVTPALTVFGAPLTLTLVVAPTAGGSIPTGTAAFADGASALATIPLNSLGQATLVLPSALLGPIAPGAHSIAAVYSGDTNYNGASASPVALTLGKATTTTTLTAPVGGPFTATVAVAPPGAGSPTGQVQFSTGGAILGTIPLQQQGASFVAAYPANSQLGSITATYMGDANFSSSASAPANVTSPKGTVTIASNHNPATLGQAVIFTVSVSGSAGLAAPTGAVLLMADSTSLGAQSLSDGLATFSTAAMTTGTHNIVANYAGDANYGSTSATLSQVVNKPAGSLSLTASPAQSVFGQPVTFTAQWQSSGTAATGQVQFFDGAAALGQSAITTGAAALTVSHLAVGTHAITASWNGDTGSPAVTCTPVSQLVDKTRTATTLSGRPGGTLSATVAAAAPGAGSPTGSVKFVNAATSAVLTTASLAAGLASTTFPAVTDPILAIYSGDSSFQPSTSDPLVQLAVTNSASYSVLNLAPDEIVTLFGSNLAPAISYATPQPADALSGTSVKITDTAGVTRSAQLFYVSPAQASVLVPSDVSPGPATLTVSNPNQSPVTIAVSIAAVAPGLFTSNSTGQGIAAGQVLRVHQNGTQDPPQNIAVFDTVRKVWVPAPINVDSTDRVFVLLYGTGIRHYASLPTVTVGSNPVGVAYAGPQGSFPGLDQVNLVLPPSLKGAGTVDLQLMVDGIAANIVTLAIQ